MSTGKPRRVYVEFMRDKDCGVPNRIRVFWPLRPPVSTSVCLVNHRFLLPYCSARAARAVPHDDALASNGTATDIVCGKHEHASRAAPRHATPVGQTTEISRRGLSAELGRH